MRILIIHTQLPFPADNGGKLRAAHVARYLAKHHEVSLACFDSAAADKAFTDKELFREIRYVPLPPPVSAVRRLFSAEPSEVLNLRCQEMRKTIAEMIERRDPSVILISEPALAPYLGHYTDRVIVLDYLMVSTLSLERLAAISRGFKRLIWSLRWKKSAGFHRRVAHLFDLCLVNSIEDRDDLLTISSNWKKLEFFPNGLLLEEYPLGLAEPDAHTLVYPGSVTYPPNHDAVEYMIQHILPLVRAEIPDVRLVVTGTVPTDGSAPKADGVVYTGRVPDVRPEIAKAWICVVPLRSGAGGTRFKLLESMALGTPLVSTTIGAEGVDYTHGSNILVSDTSDGFAAHVVALLKNPILRWEISNAARRLIEEQYDWDVLGTRLSHMLSTLISEKQ